MLLNSFNSLRIAALSFGVSLVQGLSAVKKHNNIYTIVLRSHSMRIKLNEKRNTIGRTEGATIMEINYYLPKLFRIIQNHSMICRWDMNRNKKFSYFVLSMKSWPPPPLEKGDMGNDLPCNFIDEGDFHGSKLFVIRRNTNTSTLQ